ncbi:cytochrome P450, partial [Sodiomyces alkalinus F11]
MVMVDKIDSTIRAVENFMGSSKMSTMKSMLGPLSSWSTSSQLILVLVVVVPLITYFTSALRFRQVHVRTGKDGQHVVPVVPYWIPGIRHFFSFLKDTQGFPLGLVKRYGWERPIRFQVANTGFTVVGNPDHIQTIFKNHRYLSSRSITAQSARYLLDVPPSVMPFYQADDSGMAGQIREGSKVKPENRILFHQTRSAQKFLASPFLEPLSQRFVDMLHRHVEALEIGDDWVEHPDLFKFLQVTVSRANIEAIMGTKITELNPTMVEDFWRAKRYSHLYFKGFPRWLVPKAFAARDRVLESIQKWHAYAFANSDHTNTGPKDPDWEPIFGSKYVKARLQYMLGMKPLDDRVRACEDWGLMFGNYSSNANTLPAVFWYLYEALRDPALSARMMAEAAPFVTSDKDTCNINFLDMAEQPLLQSVFAEVLRTRVSILVSRMVEYGNINFHGYTAPRDEYILMPTDALHYSPEPWERAGRTLKTPLEQFDPERFLVPSEKGTGSPEFSLDGLAGLWIPFGGGDRMCPGRHLTKMEMLITYAYLFSRYEVEMDDGDAGKVKNDMRYAPFGALPPDRPVRFKIRRK